ncbi:ABC-type Mn2+/Zn2+ transport system permease subunit [Maritalea mobilis]|uniref:ABC-type Mn2+/Zn2+ transport system permease subunit n=1 Tax=Maritalea mobilis TaxID=483324 RepID=A0A4R6VQP2_9HYPH|nr:metal ABC transporter permease [Maritalea mobilis]TDQ66353.1 ABC-type Mn2+/Zn2+ transport system permease subunit [Maritalea mobilis]
MEWIETSLLAFQFPFMQRAFVIAILVAIPAALLSCFLVLKGWSLMGDAIAHGVLPGIVIAYILAIPLAIGAFVAGMVCALGTGYLKENSRVKEDTIMGVVFSGMFALGLVLYTKIETDVHLDHILFGNMLGTSNSDILETGIIALILTVLVIARWRDLKLYVFDPQHAAAIGLPVRWLHYGLLAAISLIVVAALKAVGIILAIAILIAPGAIAYLLTRKLGPMLIIATIVAVFSAFTGVLISFHLDSAPAPTIVLIMTILFILAFFFSPAAQKAKQVTS